MTYVGQGNWYWSYHLVCEPSGFTESARRCDEDLGCDLTDCTGLADGTPCDDGDPCTWIDACLAGVCTGSASVCPACTACTVDGDCVEAPRDDCTLSTTPETGRMQFVAPGNPEKRSLRWTWKKGPELSVDDFGRPDVADDISLCVFQDASPSLIYKTTLAGGACDEPPCWKNSSDRLRYKPSGEPPSGIASISLRSGPAGKPSVQVRGKGANLTSDVFGYLSTPAPLPLRTQVQIENGACFEVRLDATSVKKNGDGVFKGSGVP